MYNNLFIEGLPFRPPNDVKTKFLDVAYVEKWDGMEGTTNVHKTVLGRKREKTFNFQYLTGPQFNFLLNYVNNDFYFVSYTENSFTFVGQYWIEWVDYTDSFGGGIADVVLTLTPQFIE